MITRPMKANSKDLPLSFEQLEALDWPNLCSPKLDGIRGLTPPKLGPVTQSFMPIPNEYVRKSLTQVAGESCLDGELVVLDNYNRVVDYNDIQSGIM